MPLEFLKRKGSTDAPAETVPTPAAAPVSASGIAMPEEVVAQEYQLKLYFAGKSSEGVRMKAGPGALAELLRIDDVAAALVEQAGHGIDDAGGVAARQGQDEFVLTRHGCAL